MKLKKRKGFGFQNSVFHLAISLIIVIAFGIGAWLLIYSEVNTHKQRDILNYGNQQMQLVDHVVMNATDILKSKPNSEQAVIENVIKQAETNGSRFWMFGTQDEILFVKNEVETQNLSSLSFTDLAKDYNINGGHNAKEFYTRIKQKQSGSFLYSKSQNAKPYLMSLQFIEVGGTTYIIALSTAQDYIVSTLDLTAHTVYVLLFAGIMILAILLLVLIYTLLIIKQKNQIAGLNKQLKDKNVVIESLSSKIEGSAMKTKECDVYDDLTGVLYNKSFLDAFLRNSTNGKLFPLGIIVFRIGAEGYCEDSVLLRVANLIRQHSDNKNILARDGNDFILVATKKSEQEIQELIQKIKFAYNQSITKYQMQVAYCTKKDVDYRLHKMLEQVFEELEQRLAIQRKENSHEIQSIQI